MTDQEKTLERLAQAVEAVYASPKRMFWRGFLWGLGRGLGTIVGFLLLIAILFYLFKLSGLEKTFNDVLDSLQKITNSVGNYRP